MKNNNKLKSFNNNCKNNMQYQISQYQNKNININFELFLFLQLL